MKSTLSRLGVATIVSGTILSTLAPLQSYAATSEGTVNTPILNVRSDSSTSSSIVGKLTEGTTVDVYAINDEWAQIEFKGQKRYVSSNYLTLLPTSIKNTNSLYIAKENAQMYTSMTSSSSIKASIKQGDTVTYLSTHGASGSWYKVSYKGNTGYVAKRYFSLSKNGSVTSQVNKSYMTIATTKVHVSTSSSSRVVVTLSKGKKVILQSRHGATNSWAKISYNGVTGYVAMKNLQSTTTTLTKSLFVHNPTNLYNSMSSSKTAIRALKPGTIVSQISTHGATGSWSKVTYQSTTGYVPTRDLSETFTPTATPYYAQQDTKLYSSMSSSKKTLLQIPKGTKVEQFAKFGASGSWYQVRYNNTTGYVVARDFALTPPIGIKKNVSYTNYPMTTQTMAERQMAQFAQTDAHRFENAYLPRAWVSVNGVTGTITKPEMIVVSRVGTALKAAASSNSSTLIKIPYGAEIEYINRYTSGSTTWYKVKYGSITGYVTPSSVVGTANILSQPSLGSHAYGQINTGEKVSITGQQGNYYTISYKRPAGHNIRVFDNTWRRASVDDLLPYVDPSQIDANSRSFYQFLDLSKSAGTTATTLNKVLTSKGTLSGQGQAFVDAASMYGVNEVYLLSHALLETGHGTSLLAKGVPVDKDGNALINSSGNRIYPERPVAATVYNMYGIQATDSNPLGNGAKYAFQQKWFSPQEAIIGGAYWIGASYINHPTYKQNTLYKMRFNPSSPGTHQYATDIGWAAKQTTSIYNIYQSLDAYTLNFDVPKYQ
ncbi:MAG: SH3 domain-containing protein [Exiguobacterium sp.]|nr:SH3 domain-containing protein [Exiguobacterium sp.]